MISKQSNRNKSISESPFTVPIRLINKQDPSLSFNLLVDKMEMDFLTISDIEEKLVGEFPNGVLEVTSAYYSPKIDTTMNLRHIEMIAPLYWELKQKIKVEVDPNFKISGFYLNIGPRMKQMDFFNQVHKQTKLEKNSYYLTLVKGSKHMRVSRNSSYAFEPQDLTGATLALKKLPEPGKMAVTVEVEQKKTVLKVAPEFTVREVIEYIDIETKVPSSIIKLIYDSEIRNDENQTLKELGVKTGETFDILRGSEIGRRLDEGVMNESFGIKFVDMANSIGPEKRKWSSSAPKWRIVTPGLSLEGKCANVKCEAFGRYVIINKGVDFAYDLREHRHTNFCPICKQKVEVELCAFNNCLYAFTGRKYAEDGKPSILVKSQKRIEAGDEYNRYSPDKLGYGDWESLVIAVYALPKKDKDKLVCPVCRNPIVEDSALLKCGHEYHSKCFGHSKDLESTSTSECTLCPKSESSLR